MPSLSQFIVWIVIGLLGGSLAGLIITWDRKGFGLLRNLAVGLVGALVVAFAQDAVTSALFTGTVKFEEQGLQASAAQASVRTT